MSRTGACPAEGERIRWVTRLFVINPWKTHGPFHGTGSPLCRPSYGREYSEGRLPHPRPPSSYLDFRVPFPRPSSHLFQFLSKIVLHCVVDSELPTVPYQTPPASPPLTYVLFSNTSPFGPSVGSGPRKPLLFIESNRPGPS